MHIKDSDGSGGSLNYKFTLFLSALSLTLQILNSSFDDRSPVSCAVYSDKKHKSKQKP